MYLIIYSHHIISSQMSDTENYPANLKFLIFGVEIASNANQPPSANLLLDIELFAEVITVCVCTPHIPMTCGCTKPRNSGPEPWHSIVMCRVCRADSE